jgi:hypothetical protein
MLGTESERERERVYGAWVVRRNLRRPARNLSERKLSRTQNDGWFHVRLERVDEFDRLVDDLCEDFRELHRLGFFSSSPSSRPAVWCAETVNKRKRRGSAPSVEAVEQRGKGCGSVIQQKMRGKHVTHENWREKSSLDDGVVAPDHDGSSRCGLIVDAGTISTTQISS